MADLEITFASVSIPANTSITLIVEEDPDQDGTFENSNSTGLTDGQTTYTLSGFDKSGDVRVSLNLDNTDDVSAAELTEAVDVQAPTIAAPDGPVTVTAQTPNAGATGEGNINVTPSGAVIVTTQIPNAGGTGSGNTNVSPDNAVTVIAETPDAGATGSGNTNVSPSGPVLVTADIPNVGGKVAYTRTSTLTADGQIDARAELTEVFPDELTTDLSWDFNQSYFGFVSEWVHEETVFGDETDAFTVILDANVTGPMQVQVEYDADGDGVPEYQTEPRTVHRDDRAISFPEIGADGYYRLILYKLRTGDNVRAVTMGPTRY